MIYFLIPKRAFFQKQIGLLAPSPGRLIPLLPPFRLLHLKQDASFQMWHNAKARDIVTVSHGHAHRYVVFRFSASEVTRRI